MTVLEQQQPLTLQVPLYEDPPGVCAVVSYDLANSGPIDGYLDACDQEADAMRQKLEAAGMTGRVSKEELLARARNKLWGDQTPGR